MDINYRIGEFFLCLVLMKNGLTMRIIQESESVFGIPMRKMIICGHHLLIVFLWMSIKAKTVCRLIGSQFQILENSSKTKRRQKIYCAQRLQTCEGKDLELQMFN